MDYPRVTEVLQPFVKYEGVPKDVLEKAAARGTSVHALCASIAKGAWVPTTMVPDDLRGYVDSFKQWHTAQVKEFVIVEERYFDEEIGYTGQLDMVVKCHDDELYLVDLKTSSRPQKTHPLQMAAYDGLLNTVGVQVKGSMVVYLSKHGEFPDIKAFDDLKQEYQVFISALTCYHYFNKGKINGKKESSPKNPGGDE